MLFHPGSQNKGSTNISELWINGMISLQNNWQVQREGISVFQARFSAITSKGTINNIVPSSKMSSVHLGTGKRGREGRGKERRKEEGGKKGGRERRKKGRKERRKDSQPLELSTVKSNLSCTS